MMGDVKYPDVEVCLSESDGNSMMIIGRVRAAMKRAGISSEERDAFSKEATSGDYDNLLRTCMKWVDVT